MTSVTAENFEDLLEGSPNFLNVSDLVEVGLYPTKVSVYKALQRREAPPSIHISVGKIRFPKNELICWLRERAALSQKSSSNDEAEAC